MTAPVRFNNINDLAAHKVGKKERGKSPRQVRSTIAQIQKQGANSLDEMNAQKRRLSESMRNKAEVPMLKLKSNSLRNRLFIFGDLTVKFNKEGIGLIPPANKPQIDKVMRRRPGRFKWITEEKKEVPVVTNPEPTPFEELSADLEDSLTKAEELPAPPPVPVVEPEEVTEVEVEVSVEVDVSELPTEPPKNETPKPAKKKVGARKTRKKRVDTEDTE